MKRFFNKTIGLAIGLALVAPWVHADAPSSVGGSLGGFSANAQGGQSAGDWGIPQNSGGQNGAGQASNSNNSNNPGNGQNVPSQGKGPDAGGYGNGQNVPSQGKGPDAGGYGNGQNNQNGNGQNTQSGGKGPDAGGYGDGQNGSGQNGPGQQNANNGNGQGEHYNDGPTKNNSNNPDGDGSGHGEHYDDGPTKNNSNNPDGDHAGSAEGEGPTKNNSNNPDGGSNENHGNSSGNGNGNGNGSGSGSGSSGGGSNGGGDFPPLDPGSDGQYDPGQNGGDQQIPSNCAEANSQCGQCVQRNEAKLQFNRRYLHVAWSTTHQTLEYTKQAIAFGDGVSEMSKSSLSWQLTGKPQIIEAVQSLRHTYADKYQIYINNMEEAMNEMTACEADNYSVQSLYRQFSGLYLDFVKARYQSPD